MSHSFATKAGAILFSAILLSGCAGEKIKSVKGSEGGRPLSVGYIDSSAYYSDVVFFRIVFENGSYRVAEISDVIMMPRSSSEEVLGFRLSSNMVGPAYSSNTMFNPKSRKFSCMLADGVKKTEYHPCGTGSRFVVTSTASSVGRNLIAIPFTWGLAAGMDYSVDSESVRKVVIDLDLEKLARRYASLVQYSRDSNKALDQKDKELQVSTRFRLNLKNNTGFPDPVVSNIDIGFKFSRVENVESIGALIYAGDDSLFADAQARLKERYERLSRERNFTVRCATKYSVWHFDGDISCSTKLRYASSGDVPDVSVVLNSVSYGVRYPELKFKDKNISIEIRSGEMFISNLTGSFIEIKSIALYGGKEIVETPMDFSLSPLATHKKPFYLQKLASDQLTRMFTFNNIRKSDVNNKVVDFGVAVKYRVGNGGNFDSAFEKRRFKMESLISN